MAIKRRTINPALQEEPVAPPAGGAVALAPMRPAPLIGAPCDPMTPGWLMGIGRAAETAADHATRLGASTDAYTDAGWLMGSLEARPGWPAFPIGPCPMSEADWNTHKADVTWLTAHARDFRNCTNFDNAWRDCASLTTFPLIDTSSGTSFSSTWKRCTNLTTFPLIDTSSGTNFGNTWLGCASLTTFPLIDTSSGTDFNGAWMDCSSLTAFPLIDTSSVTNFDIAWQNCANLTAFPLIDTSSGTSFDNAWLGCTSLTAFPLIDTGSGTIFNGTWLGCTSLTTFPLLNFSSGTSFANAWQGCTSLTPQSTENILASLDANGRTGLRTDVGGCPKSTWTPAAVTAYDSLVAKGWTITKVN